MDALRFSGHDIVFQEVPGEVSLAINVTGCPRRCPGCHSEYLQKYFGDLLLESIGDLLDKYEGMITCVCFFGGDQNLNEIKAALKTVKLRSMKTCLYTGADDINDLSDLLSNLDFLKTGAYMSGLGGLSAPSTNQRFYAIDGGELVDKTYLFWRKTIE